MFGIREEYKYIKIISMFLLICHRSKQNRKGRKNETSLIEIDKDTKSQNEKLVFLKNLNKKTKTKKVLGRVATLIESLEAYLQSWCWS